MKSLSHYNGYGGFYESFIEKERKIYQIVIYKVGIPYKPLKIINFEIKEYEVQHFFNSVVMSCFNDAPIKKSCAFNDFSSSEIY